MSDQNGAQAKVAQHPTNDNIKSRIEYWREQGQPWRKEPEIDAERQKYLSSKRHRILENKKWFSPLKDVSLSRADIEWLLAAYENEQGPALQSDRPGLDLAGVDLRGKDLSFLPLAGVGLGEAHLEGANLYAADLEEASFAGAHLEKANLFAAHLEKANFAGAYLQRANLSIAHLEGAKLAEAHLEGADLNSSYLDGETNLYKCRFYSQEVGGVILADIHWGDVNVGIVDWSILLTLGDETLAWHYKNDDDDDDLIGEEWHLEYKERAVRAYRQLAILLRNQGLNEEAARFSYRAQLMRRKLLRHQHKYRQWLFSLFLFLVSGYGYEPWNAFFTYLTIISAFALIYFIVGRTVGPALSLPGSFVFSLTSFHGRGFFPGGITLDDPLTRIAAVEAFFGLLVEATFIATLIRRLFGG